MLQRALFPMWFKRYWTSSLECAGSLSGFSATSNVAAQLQTMLSDSHDGGLNLSPGAVAQSSTCVTFIANWPLLSSRVAKQSDVDPSASADDVAEVYGDHEVGGPMRVRLDVTDLIRSRLNYRASACFALAAPAECIVCWKLSAGHAKILTAATSGVKAETIWADDFETIYLYLSVRLDGAGLHDLARLNLELVEHLKVQATLRIFVIDENVDLLNALVVEIPWRDEDRRRARRLLETAMSCAERGELRLDFMRDDRRIKVAYSAL